MRHALAASLAGMLVLSSLALADAPESVSSKPPRTPEEERKAFRLPEGFEAQLVVAEPEIHKPLNLAFDDRGRLWVTETVEYPFPAAEGATPRDGVKILSDFGPDGRARKVETFATGLNIPIGVLPILDGRSALVHSIPSVYRLTDTDGDGKADKKEALYHTYGYKDTHGMTNAFTWGFDGWVYACHGFSNESRVSGKDKSEIVMQSGNVYRMRPDGSHLEYVTHGQVNPFGLSFDPLGNLYSCDCHSRPVYQLLRGAWYPSFGKPDDGLGYGPEMCTHDHGSTAISGIVYYSAEHFPEPYRGRLLIGNVMTNRINQDRIEWHGSTPEAVEQPDFLVSEDNWFRPVDIELGPDGALYVADFYNRIIGHYEVPLTHPGRDRERGRIWRIVYRGKDGKDNLSTPHGYTFGAFSRNTNVRQLAYELGNPNLAVRTRAANRLAAPLSETPYQKAEHRVLSLQRLAEMPDSPLHRAQALWVLHRVDGLKDAVLTKALDDNDRLVRVHAQKILAERKELSPSLLDRARKGLTDPDPFVRRAAAEALGRHPDEGNLKPLLALRGAVPAEDTHLLHVVRMALRDQMREDAAWKRVVAEGLDDRAVGFLADVAPGVPSEASARFLFDELKRRGERRKGYPHGELLRYIRHVARYGGPGLESGMLGLLGARADDQGPRLGRWEVPQQVEQLRAFQRGVQERGGGLSAEARDWATSLARVMLTPGRPAAETLAGIGLANELKLAGVRDRLAEIVSGDANPEPHRLEALSALASVDPQAATPTLIAVLNDAARPLSLRDRAATLLGATNRPEAQPALLAALPTAPERVQSAIAAALAARKPGAEALLDAVATGKASARLLQNNRVAGPLGNSGAKGVKARVETLLKGLPPADQAVRALIASRRAGFGLAKPDPAEGAKVFETNCAACHQIGGKGAKIGPQLDGVGLRGLDRILEDVLDPSRNVDQMFRTTTLALNDGRVVTGLLLREEGEVLVLADAQGKEVRVPVSTVEERSIQPLSPMPANFAQQVPEEEFYKLVAYLLSRRPEK